MAVKWKTAHAHTKYSKKLYDDQFYIPLIPLQPVIDKLNNELKENFILDSYLIPEFKQRGIEYIIRMSGSSMCPKYNNGDLLGCKFVHDTSFYQWGEVYVLNTKQGTMIKRLFPSEIEGSLECRSDNEEYPPFLINKDSICSLSIVLGMLKLE
ncbi:S24 family peptidase [Myroides indicus]|uniref:Peptidase S24-like protein n=1 Tax=Myroides indicus TaxID=1323422 RepID=A0A4R7ER42_9FLAO|nr:S24 family peptidase [Myroides indicus]TDS50599.1 peptidase S24-like protein [Myroides indicus]